MGLQVIKESETKYNPVFLSILEDVVGGVTISTTRIPSTTKFLFPGTPLAASASSVGLYNIVKTAKLKCAIDTAACVTCYVYSSTLPNAPGQNFKVGEWVMLDGGGSACTIASITIGTKTNGVGTDTIVFTAGGGGFNYASVATGTLIVEAANDVTTLADAKFDADCILRDAVRVRLESGYTLQNVTAAAVVRGTIDESISSCAYPSDGVKTPITARMRFA
jgi:hypothetical protein